MPAFCNLNVSWNAHAPRDTMVEVRCRVYAAGAWTAWMSFGKWAPDYPRASISTHSDDGLIFLMGDTVTVALPGGGTGVQLGAGLSIPCSDYGAVYVDGNADLRSGDTSIGGALGYRYNF